jgi:hypothetical protein
MEGDQYSQSLPDPRPRPIAEANLKTAYPLSVTGIPLNRIRYKHYALPGFRASLPPGGQRAAPGQEPAFRSKNFPSPR